MNIPFTKTNSSPIKIFHGPENIGGIGRFLADWQRNRKGVQSDFIVYADNTTFQNSHLNLHLNKKSQWQSLRSKIKFFLYAIKKYDLFHFYFGKSLLPFNLDMPIIKLVGKKMIMNYLGSDIRLTSLELKRNPYYYLIKDFEKSQAPSDFLKWIRMKWQSLWCDYCFAVRGLYVHARKAYPPEKIIHDLWIPNTMEVNKQKPALKLNKEPIIVHAPSNVNRKGTTYVLRAIHELKQEGYHFDFKLCQGLSHEEFEYILQNESDIVVDQLINGDFGNLAMEAMCFGKPVCSFVMVDIREMTPDLPIIQCTIDDIKDKLAWLIENPQERIKLSEAGWKFAQTHFDREKIFEKLWTLYLGLLRK